MLMTCHLPSIHSRMEKCVNIAFMYYIFLELLCKSYFIPVSYELDKLTDSTNETDFYLCIIYLYFMLGCLH